jgi:mannose-6-phosphate isomerase-like protein (cupin superfamily)
MQISYKHQAIEIKNNESCIVTKPLIHDESMDFASVKINGRYPTARLATNKKCKEIIYVNEGSGKVVVDGKEHLFNAGDVILLEAGEVFYWEGNMTLFISCRPAWTPEQHVVLE